MKAFLMGYRLQLLEVEEKTRTKVAGKGLQKCFQEWYGHWQTPVTTERNYVEGSVQQTNPYWQNFTNFLTSPCACLFCC